MKDNVIVTGSPTFTLTGPNGEVKNQFTVPNLVVTNGKIFLASRAVNDATVKMSHMSIGTNNTAANGTNSTLVAELARVALTSSSAASNTITYTATFGPGVGTGALVEAGIFNAASAGSMLCRTTFNVVNKDSVDTLTVSWDITIN